MGRSLPWAMRPTLGARPRTSRNATGRRGDGSRGAPSPSPATTSTTLKGPEATLSTSVRPQATPREDTTPTSSGPGTWWPSTATARRSAVALVPPRRGGSRRTSPPTRMRGAPSLICTIHASAPGRNTAPLPGGWRNCGRRSTRGTQTWSSPATSTTTSASRRRTRRGGQTLSGASASSWWAPAAAENYPIGDPMENTEVYKDETDGVLRLKLEQNGYEWEFVPVEGDRFTDSG